MELRWTSGCELQRSRQVVVGVGPFIDLAPTAASSSADPPSHTFSSSPTCPWSARSSWTLLPSSPRSPAQSSPRKTGYNHTSPPTLLCSMYMGLPFAAALSPQSLFPADGTSSRTVCGCWWWVVAPGLAGCRDLHVDVIGLEVGVVGHWMGGKLRVYDTATERMREDWRQYDRSADCEVWKLWKTGLFYFVDAW